MEKQLETFRIFYAWQKYDKKTDTLLTTNLCFESEFEFIKDIPSKKDEGYILRKFIVEEITE